MRERRGAAVLGVQEAVRRVRGIIDEPDADPDEEDYEDLPALVHGDSESSEEDEVEVAPRAAAPAAKRARANTAAWTEELLPVHFPAFDDTGCGPKIPPCEQALAVLDHWWVPLRTQLVKATNSNFHLIQQEKFSARLDGFKSVTDAEMDAFFCILIYLGIHPQPNQVEAWAPPPHGLEFVKGIMSRDRFLQIKRCLAIATPNKEANAADKLAKARVAQDIFNEVSPRVYKPGQRVSLDEAQIQCAHRVARVSFRAGKNKPLSDYIKTFSINECGTSYCPRFLIDERNGRSVRDYVMALTEPLVGRAHVLYLDRYYTSVDTALALSEVGLFTVGTVRTDRGVPKELIDDVKRRPLADAESRYRMAPTPLPDQPLSVVVFRDTSADGFYVLSNVHNPADTEVIKRRKKGVAGLVPKDAPVAVADYNKGMGYVDSMNHMKVNYSVSLTYKYRWYMGIIFYVLELSIINALVVFRQLGHEDLRHLDFRKQLITQLAARAKVAARQNSAPEPEPVPEHLREAHIIVRLPSQRRCVHCFQTDGRSCKTSYGCATCGKALHADCFFAFH